MNNNKISCPVSKKCGGCQLLNLSYPEQLKLKQSVVERLLKKFCRVEKIIGMDHPYHYRNKVQAAFYTNKQGKIISGVYQSGSHHVVGIDCCLTEDETYPCQKRVCDKSNHACFGNRYACFSFKE